MSSSYATCFCSEAAGDIRTAEDAGQSPQILVAHGLATRESVVWWGHSLSNGFRALAVTRALPPGTITELAQEAYAKNPVPELAASDFIVRGGSVYPGIDGRSFAELQSSNPVVYQAMSSIPFFTSPTIRKEKLLRPFSHMTQGNGLRQLRTADGEVKAHGLELVLRRRMTKGLMLQANYTALHQRDRDFYYDEFDALPSWRLSNAGTPHRIAFVGIYELPFGRTKPMLQSGIGNALLGGWQVAWTYEWQPGPYLDWGNVFYTGDPKNIALDKSERTLDRWFNTDGFVRVANQQPAAFHRRVFPSRVGNVRGDELNRWDANIQREFRLREGLAFQLKADFINLINRTQFANPNLNPTSTDFGRVTANSSSTARFVLLQGRLTF